MCAERKERKKSIFWTFSFFVHILWLSTMPPHVEWIHEAVIQWCHYNFDFLFFVFLYLIHLKFHFGVSMKSNDVWKETKSETFTHELSLTWALKFGSDIWRKYFVSFPHIYLFSLPLSIIISSYHIESLEIFFHFFSIYIRCNLST